MKAKAKTTGRKQDGKPALKPKLRFPEFRDAEGWGVEGLGEVGEFVNERIPVERLNVTDYVSTENILPDYGGVVRASKLPSTGSATRFRPNDILVSNIRPYLKKVWFSNKEGGASNDVIVIRAKHQLLTEYFPFLLKNDSFIGYVMTGAKGVKMPRGDVASMKEYPAFYPSKPEQQKIADCLSSVDEMIAAQARKMDALKTHKKGLMQQLFPREGETRPRLRFPEFQAAGEWETQPFEEFVTKSFYGTSSSTSPKGQYPVLRMGNMTGGGLDFSNLVYIDLDPDSFESFRLQDGDILLNRTNSPALVGKISIFRLKTDCITASYIVTYRLNKKRIDPSFCNFMLNTPLYQAKIKALAKPSISQANINPTTFKKELLVSVPAVPEQQRIASCLSSLDALIVAQTQKLEALKTHKQGLMQQLFPRPETDL